MSRLTLTSVTLDMATTACDGLFETSAALAPACPVKSNGIASRLDVKKDRHV
ncbi:hypothetical protein QIH01_11430 [Brevibacillus brevis]|uniref:hypothetical protein n=1 Tax=Brevibacillus brevis TaxID=1393 RepID=UPI0012F8FBB1|nr:hypothetical protein QIH01_11430 [Brevibacillus brevis]